MTPGKFDNMESIYELWKTREMDKYRFLDAMHQYHQILFQYAKWLQDVGGNVESFHISAQGVVITTRSQVRFACDPNDVCASPLWAFSFGDVGEGKSAHLLQRLMPGGGVFFDIGANVGWYSLYIAKSCPKAQIFAFEPLPATYDWLQRNIALNSFTNCKAFNFGLSEKEEKLTFYFRPDMTGAASMQNITESDQAVKYTCLVRRLDDCWREIGRNPALVKCDVEGAELLVFRGAKDCLAEARPIIFCEMLRKWTAKFNYTPNDTINFLGELGYGCFEPVENGLKSFPRMTEETLETNFFFLHHDKHAAIISQYLR